MPRATDCVSISGLLNCNPLQVIYDKITGRSRGFAFVTMSTVEEVEAAVQEFNGYVSVIFLYILVSIFDHCFMFKLCS